MKKYKYETTQIVFDYLNKKYKFGDEFKNKNLSPLLDNKKINDQFLRKALSDICKDGYISRKGRGQYIYVGEVTDFESIKYELSNFSDNFKLVKLPEYILFENGFTNQVPLEKYEFVCKKNDDLLKNEMFNKFINFKLSNYEIANRFVDIKDLIFTYFDSAKLNIKVNFSSLIETFNSEYHDLIEVIDKRDIDESKSSDLSFEIVKNSLSKVLYGKISDEKYKDNFKLLENYFYINKIS